MRLDLSAVLGLLLLPVLYTQFIAPRFLTPRLEASSLALMGMAVLWLCAGAALVSWRIAANGSLGKAFPGAHSLHGSWSRLTRPTTRGVILALGLGLVLSLFVPVLTLLAQSLLGATQQGGIGEITTGHAPWLLALSVLTAAFTEEIIFRGYPVERLAGQRGGELLGALLGLVAFVAVHAGSWNLAHVVGVVLPLGAALSAIYLVRRQLWFVMIVHLMIDLPLVVMSVMSSQSG